MLVVAWFVCLFFLAFLIKKKSMRKEDFFSQQLKIMGLTFFLPKLFRAILMTHTNMFWLCSHQLIKQTLTDVASLHIARKKKKNFPSATTKRICLQITQKIHTLACTETANNFHNDFSLSRSLSSSVLTNLIVYLASRWSGLWQQIFAEWEVKIWEHTICAFFSKKH